jgi:monoterpene epsilon-lactone hydrolase
MIEDERLYSGTFFPSPFRRWITYYSFQTLFYLFCGIEWIRDCFALKFPNSSCELRAIRRLFSMTKNWTTNSLKGIRQPFLSIITRSFRKDQLLEVYPGTQTRVGVWTGINFTDPSRVILYIHGGGYVSGDIAGFLPVADKISTILKCPVFVPEYSLVPEYTVKDSIQDLIYALKRVIEQYPNTPVYLCGDSAGGGLLFRLINEWIEQKGTYKPIYKCVVWSPMIDLSIKGESMWTNQDLDPCLNVSTVKYCADLAYPSDMDCPWVMKWELFPETRIVVCKDEILLSDSRKAYQLLRRTTLEEVSDSFHGFPLFWEYIPEALQEIYKLDDFFQMDNKNDEL